MFSSSHVQSVSDFAALGHTIQRDVVDIADLNEFFMDDMEYAQALIGKAGSLY